MSFPIYAVPFFEYALTDGLNAGEKEAEALADLYAFERRGVRILKLEKGYAPMTCLVIGHPAVKYKRIPPRKDAKINVI